MTIQIFLSFWQKVGPPLTFMAGDEASYNEWEDGNCKYQGMRKAGAAKHGIVRTIYGDDCIEEATWYEDKRHGLCFDWPNHNFFAFQAIIHDHGEFKACIYWNDDWSEEYSEGDKELILENNGLSIFKP